MVLQATVDDTVFALSEHSMFNEMRRDLRSALAHKIIADVSFQGIILQIFKLMGDEFREVT